MTFVRHLLQGDVVIISLHVRALAPINNMPGFCYLTDGNCQKTSRILRSAFYSFHHTEPLSVSHTQAAGDTLQSGCLSWRSPSAAFCLAQATGQRRKSQRDVKKGTSRQRHEALSAYSTVCLQMSMCIHEHECRERVHVRACMHKSCAYAGVCVVWCVCE